MVLNVKADDSVRVTWMNALRRAPGTCGLKDAPGDALLPKITPLNVDVRWSPEEQADDTSNENATLTSELDLDDDIDPSCSELYPFRNEQATQLCPTRGAQPDLGAGRFGSWTGVNCHAVQSGYRRARQPRAERRNHQETQRSTSALAATNQFNENGKELPGSAMIASQTPRRIIKPIRWAELPFS